MAKSHPKWQKIISVALIISGPYIIWLSVMVHMCKMIICKMIKFSGVFFKFSGVEGQKMAQNDNKI